MIGRLVRGAAAGTAAAGVMGTAMVVAGRAGLVGAQPPERIVEGLMAKASVPGDAPDAVAVGAHLGFGAAAGALYALLAPRPGPTTAVPYALGVWAASYQGWVPALGLLPPASRDRKDRVAVMVAAHLLYGLVLGRVAGRAH